MNREYPCEVIQDLLPGYIDGILSKTGADAVKEHLKECEGCRRVMRKWRKKYILHRIREQISRNRRQLTDLGSCAG